MNERERLIDLIFEKQNRGEQGRHIPNDPYAKILPGTPVSNKELADHLLSNGVIVPPCKVGDMLYTVGVFTGQIIGTKVTSIIYDESDIYLFGSNFTTTSVTEQLGKTVFLTREEAEKALKEHEQK